LSEKYPQNFFVKFLSSDFAKKVIASDFSSEWEKGSDEVLLVPRILEKAAKICQNKILEQVKQSLRLVGAFIGAQAKLAFAEFLAECETLDAEVFFDKSAKELDAFLKREKSAENVTLLNTAGANAVSMLKEKKQSEQIAFFHNLMLLRSNGWGEVLAAILLRVKELNDTSIHKLLTQSDLADFLIDYQLSAKAKAQAKN
jgi:hypothetical protein